MAFSTLAYPQLESTCAPARLLGWHVRLEGHDPHSWLLYATYPSLPERVFSALDYGPLPTNRDFLEWVADCNYILCVRVAPRVAVYL